MATEPLTTATAATVGRDRIGILLDFEPAWSGALISGPAHTVGGVSGDNLALHHALVSAPSGCVLVADLQGGRDCGHWGDLLTVAAEAAHVVGLVINGSIRDRRQIAEARFPLFHRGTSPRQATKEKEGEVGVPIEIDGVTIRSGDLIIADDDGIVVVPRSEADTVAAAGRDLELRETELSRRLKSGEKTVDVLGLPGPTR